MGTGVVIPTLKKHKNGQAYVKWRGSFHYFGPADRPDLARFRRFLAETVEGAGGVEEPLDLDYVSGSVSELVAAYLEAKEREYAKSVHLRRYLDRWRMAFRGLLERFGDLPAAQFSSKAFQQVREMIARQPGRSRGYVNDLANEVRLLVKWGVAQERMPPGNLVAIKAVGIIGIGRTNLPEGRKVKPVDPRIVEQTLPFLFAPVRAICELLLETGARPSEIAEIRETSIDFKGPNATWVYRPAKHKTLWKGKERFVMLNDACQKILKPWLNGSTPCFVNDRTGEAYRAEQIRKAIDSACKRAGVPYWFPYQTRHTSYSAIAEEEGTEAASLVHGHASTAMAKLYDHSTLQRAAKVVQGRRRA